MVDCLGFHDSVQPVQGFRQLVQIGASAPQLLVGGIEMMANHLDFSDFAGRGNPGMEQGIEHVGLQGLLAGFQLALQVVPFLIGEADQGLMVPQAMSFWVHGLIHLAPSSFDLCSKFFRGSKGSEAPLQVSRQGDARSIDRTREAFWMAGAKRVAIQKAKLAYHHRR